LTKTLRNVENYMIYPKELFKKRNKETSPQKVLYFPFILPLSINQ